MTLFVTHVTICLPTAVRQSSVLQLHASLRNSCRRVQHAALHSVGGGAGGTGGAGWVHAIHPTTIAMRSCIPRGRSTGPAYCWQHLTSSLRFGPIRWYSRVDERKLPACES